ncbi:hypothetical protein HFO06_11150 [Rhizobium leguminosarum]|uniref:hypothetical protein n=1 Tax=Rhizobium leguminosarum TaxID=384 RepID=UPI001C94CC2D|nr:hypothetical protein [Rhizobium leguminosarum]MBY5763645.1 hypothetical protein [Rhizobium leguminosarum]
MKYIAPYGSPDPDAAYVDRDVPGAVVGSKIPAKFPNWTMREIVDVITKSGITPDDVLQLAAAIRSQKMNYFVPGGTANALTITMAPVPVSYTELIGVPIRLKISTANTGAMTLNVNGLGNKAITGKAAAALASGDAAVGDIVAVMYDGTQFQVTGVVASGVAANYILAGRPAQAAPFFTANGVGGGASYVSNVRSTSTDLALTDNSFLDAGTSLTGGVLTIGPKDAGIWSLSTTLGLNTAQASWTSKVHLTKNGSTIFGFAQANIYGTSDTGIICASASVRLASGDTVRAEMLQNFGSTQTSSAQGRFSGSRIGV